MAVIGSNIGSSGGGLKTTQEESDASFRRIAAEAKRMRAGGGASSKSPAGKDSLADAPQQPLAPQTGFRSLPEMAMTAAQSAAAPKSAMSLGLKATLGAAAEIPYGLASFRGNKPEGGIDKLIFELGKYGKQTREEAHEEFDKQIKDKPWMNKVADYAAFYAPEILPAVIGGAGAVAGMGVKGAAKALPGFAAKMGGAAVAAEGAKLATTSFMPKVERDANGKLINTDENMSNAIFRDAHEFAAENVGGLLGFGAVNKVGKLIKPSSIKVDGVNRKALEAAEDIAKTAPDAGAGLPDVSTPARTAEVISSIGQKLGAEGLTLENMLNKPNETIQSFFGALEKSDPKQLTQIEPYIAELTESDPKLGALMQEYLTAIKENDPTQSTLPYVKDRLAAFQQNAMEKLAISEELGAKAANANQLKEIGSSIPEALQTSANTINSAVDTNIYQGSEVASRIYRPLQSIKNLFGDIYENLGVKAFINKGRGYDATDIAVSDLSANGIRAFEASAPQLLEHAFAINQTQVKGLTGVEGSRVPTTKDVKNLIEGAKRWILKDIQTPEGSEKASSTIKSLTDSPLYETSEAFRNEVDSMATLVINGLPPGEAMNKQLMPNLDTLSRKLMRSLDHSYDAVSNVKDPSKAAFRLDEVGALRGAMNNIYREMQVGMSGASEDQIGALNAIYSKLRRHEDLMRGEGVSKPSRGDVNYSKNNSQAMSKLMSNRSGIESILENLNEIDILANEFKSARGFLGNDMNASAMGRHVNGVDPYRKAPTFDEGLFNGSIDDAIGSLVTQLKNETMDGFGAMLAKEVNAKKLDLARDPKSRSLVEQLLSTQEITPMHKMVQANPKLKNALFIEGEAGLQPRSTAAVRDSLLQNPELVKEMRAVKNDAIQNTLTDVENFHIEDMNKKAFDIITTNDNPVDVQSKLAMLLRDNAQLLNGTEKGDLVLQDMKSLINSLKNPDVMDSMKQRGYLENVYKSTNELKSAQDSIVDAERLLKEVEPQAEAAEKMRHGAAKKVEDILYKKFQEAQTAYQSALKKHNDHLEKVATKRETHFQSLSDYAADKIEGQEQLVRRLTDTVMNMILPGGKIKTLWNKWGQIKEAQSRAEIEQLVRTVRTPSELSQKIEALARNEKLRQQKLEELTLKEQEAKDKQWKKKLLRTTVLASLIGSSD